MNATRVPSGEHADVAQIPARPMDDVAPWETRAGRRQERRGRRARSEPSGSQSASRTSSASARGAPSSVMRASVPDISRCARYFAPVSTASSPDFEIDSRCVSGGPKARGSVLSCRDSNEPGRMARQRRAEDDRLAVRHEPCVEDRLRNERPSRERPIRRDGWSRSPWRPQARRAGGQRRHVEAARVHVSARDEARDTPGGDLGARRLRRSRRSALPRSCDARLADVAQPRLRILLQAAPEQAAQRRRGTAGSADQSGSLLTPTTIVSVTSSPVKGPACR